MFKYQQSVPRNPLNGFVLNLTSALVIVFGLTGPASAVSLTDFCQAKATFAGEVFGDRDNLTKDEVMEAIVEEWRATGRVTPWYMVVDVQRIVNDVYRKSRSGVYRKTDREEFVNSEAGNCRYYGF